MSLKSRTYWLCPRSWFPAHNPIARSLARLCVLREDLYIEWLGLAAGEITITLPDTAELPFPSLDDNGDAYRRIYFLRASLRTLTEVYSAASSLRNNKDFRKLYRNFNQTKYDQFNEYLRALDKNLKELKRLRNALGGHVSKEGIQ